jgi:hypothetical protein
MLIDPFGCTIGLNQAAAQSRMAARQSARTRCSTPQATADFTSCGSPRGSHVDLQGSFRGSRFATVVEASLYWM